MSFEEDFSSWQSIQDLPEDWQTLSAPDLPPLVNLWNEQVNRLRNSKVYKDFLGRMRRRIAIETGVIERLYTIDRGITELLVEQGINEALIPHGATNRPAYEVIEIIQDHETAINGLFDFVKHERQLSTSYIKQLHQTLTRHQELVEAKDPSGRIGTIPLLRGEWKRSPNNPRRPDGENHIYCPPEQTAPQMELLIRWYLEHIQQGVTTEIEAAWLHHRFTQIHPFQDGNGRVARCLASLVFIRDKWFPLVITRDDNNYIQALEIADGGNLKPLVDLFAKSQRQAFISGLSLSEQVLSEEATSQVALDYAIEKLKAKDSPDKSEAERYAHELFKLALQRFEKMEQELISRLRNVVANSCYVSSAQDHDNRASYHYHQIVETAKILNYYANPRNYSSWVKLSIDIKDIKTEILLSFHAVGLGREHEGLLACSACGYRKFRNEEGENSSIQDLQP